MKNFWIIFIIFLCAFLGLETLAVGWDQCRNMGLSAVDCKKYEDDPVFRAQVRESLGLNSPRSLPAPASQPEPSVITSCDRAGCWDNLGNRYNRGSGTTYFGPSGACQKVGNMMQCP